MTGVYLLRDVDDEVNHSTNYYVWYGFPPQPVSTKVWSTEVTVSDSSLLVRHLDFKPLLHKHLSSSPSPHFSSRHHINGGLPGEGSLAHRNSVRRKW